MHFQRILFIILLMVSTNTFAINKTKVSEASCSGIDKKINRIDSKLRAGYKLKQGEILKNKLRKLKKIKYACRMKRFSTK